MGLKSRQFLFHPRNCDPFADHPDTVEIRHDNDAAFLCRWRRV